MCSEGQGKGKGDFRKKESGNGGQFGGFDTWEGFTVNTNILMVTYPQIYICIYKYIYTISLTGTPTLIRICVRTVFRCIGENEIVCTLYYWKLSKRYLVCTLYYWKLSKRYLVCTLYYWKLYKRYLVCTLYYWRLSKRYLVCTLYYWRLSKRYLVCTLY